MFVLWLLKTSAIGFVIRQPIGLTQKAEFFKIMTSSNKMSEI